jgi:hypothetical protein
MDLAECLLDSTFRISQPGEEFINLSLQALVVGRCWDATRP